MAELKIGDTIKCKNGEDMLITASQLSYEGIICTTKDDFVLEIVDIFDGESEV